MTDQTSRRYGTYIGIVKKNDDPQNMGRCSVWIPEFGGDPDVETNWHIVGYASPFAGSTPVENNRKDGSDQASTQTSYGFWMQPPDLDNRVLVTFANGDTAYGFWFACLYQQNMNHSVPTIASNVSSDSSLSEQGIYPPTVEYNKKANENPETARRPVFEPLHNGLTSQGLEKDGERGRASGGARRESPSKTFGYLTPRGNSLMVDDHPENELIRLRTRGGTQVLIHETSGYVYINSKNGNSWIEISDEGIDIYSKKSVSIRAEEDLNFRADRDIFIEGERGVFIRAGQAITTHSGQNTHMKAGTDFKVGAGGVLQTKATGAHNAQSGGDMTLKAGGNMLRTASQLHDNGPSAASVEMPSVKTVGDRTSTQASITGGDAKAIAGKLTSGVTKAVTSAKTLGTTALSAATSTSSIAAGLSGGIQTQLAGISAQASKITETARFASDQLSAVKTKITDVSSQLNNAITDATQKGMSVVATAQKNILNVPSIGDTVSKSIDTLTSGVGSQIGGKLGTQLTPQVNGIINGAASKATGELFGIVGQAGPILSTVTTTSTAIGQVQGISAIGLGKINTARAALANVMTETQSAGNRLKTVAASATNVADQITNFTGTAAGDLSSGQQATLSAAATALKNTATNATKAAADLTATATQAQSKMAPEAAVSTITARMPAHEPWQWHVKEGQQSISTPKTAEEMKADAVRSAASRPGMSSSNGTPPSLLDASEIIATGSGDVVRKITPSVSPLVQLGSNLVRHDVISAVREAASVANVDTGYLLAKASEMNFNPLSTLSGSVGLMQMGQGVFTDMVSKAGAQFGVGQSDITNPRANILMGALMTNENSTYLEDRGVATGPTELNMAHLMGPSVAAQFLLNHRRDGDAPAYASVPEDFSRSHRKIFYGVNGAARSLNDVYSTFESKIKGKSIALKGQLDSIIATTKVTTNDFPDGFFE